MSGKQTVQGWPPQSIEDRCSACITMLYLHDLLTDSELARVTARFQKQWPAAKPAKKTKR